MSLKSFGSRSFAAVTFVALFGAATLIQGKLVLTSTARQMALRATPRLSFVSLYSRRLVFDLQPPNARTILLTLTKRVLVHKIRPREAVTRRK